jgi:branched-chain amino acid transport system permease protein
MTFPDKLLSGDRPGHPAASTLLILLGAGLLLAPILIPGTATLDTAGRIAVLALLAVSYDLLLGYAGIVSFAHTVFFAIGAYGVAIPLSRHLAPWPSLLGGTLGAAILAALVAALVALISLRVRRIFFAMITLAVAGFGQLLASQLRGLTGGEDGLSFQVPRLFSPGFRPFPHLSIMGTPFDGRLFAYEAALLVAAILFLFLLRVVNAPFGSVLMAIRENEDRAEALGYQVILYRSIASALGAAIAAVAGALFALLTRYTGPDATLSFSLMTDLLLMVVIGGMGTLYGPLLGAAVIVIAQDRLEPALAALQHATANLPLLPTLLAPERWLLWMGLLFVLIVRFLPAGIVGTLRKR